MSNKKAHKGHVVVTNDLFIPWSIKIASFVYQKWQLDYKLISNTFMLSMFDELDAVID